MMGLGKQAFLAKCIDISKTVRETSIITIND